MAVMTRMQFAKSLEDGLAGHFGMAYDDWPEEHSQIFEQRTSTRAFEEIVQQIGLGYAQELEEGAEYATDEGGEGWTKRFTARSVALSFEITDNAIQDNRYMNLGQQYARSLARSLRQTKEVYHANVFNNADQTGIYAGGDGVALLSTVHPLAGGGTASNTLAAGADLSEDALEQILITIRNFKDDRGIPCMAKPRRLIVSTTGEPNAVRITKSNLRVETADNDLNYVKYKGHFNSDPFALTNLTDANAWFVQTDMPDGFITMNRQKTVMPKATIDPKTDNICYRAKERYDEGFVNWRCVAGSMGSS